MFDWLFGKKKQEEKKEEIDITNYGEKQAFLLSHLLENIDRLESQLLTTNVRYSNEIHHESSRMQLLAIRFIATQINDLQKNTLLIEHDLEELRELAQAVKKYHLKSENIELHRVGLQHAIEHHCTEIKNLQEENKVLIGKVMNRYAKWEYRGSISKTEQADIKTDLVTIRDELNYSIDNVKQVHQYLKNVALLAKNLQNEETKAASYAFHALHLDMRDSLEELTNTKLKSKHLPVIDKFIQGTKNKLALMHNIALVQDIDKNMQTTIITQIKQMSELVTMLEDARSKVDKKLNTENRVRIHTHLHSLKDVFEDFSTKVKLLNT